MFVVGICDDDEQLCFSIENTLIAYAKSALMGIQTEVYFSGEELCSDLSNGKYLDMIFLDIEMKLLNGIETGLKIRNFMKNRQVEIVYISSHDSYALELFKIRPMEFLIKPLDPCSIIEVFERCIKLTKNEKTFQYSIKHELYKISVDNIFYFNSQDREVNIHSVDGISTFYGTLDGVYNKLKQNDFIRIHRSYLVNFNKIKVFMRDQVQLVNDELIPISRSKQKEVKNLRRLLPGKLERNYYEF